MRKISSTPRRLLSLWTFLPVFLSPFEVNGLVVPSKPWSALGRAVTSGTILSYDRRTAALGRRRQPNTAALNSVPSANLLVSLHGEKSFCLTALLLLSTAGITLERRSVLGKALSAPLATMALAMTVANVGLIPFASPVYAVINQYFVSLAVPMLLYDSDMRRVIRDTGSVLVAFLVGALSTVVGTLFAYPLLPMKSLGDQGWRVACALAARHIGGAINFVAVAETLNIDGSVVSAAIAADNVVVALYFSFLFSISEAGSDDAVTNTAGTINTDDSKKVEHSDPEDVSSDSDAAIGLPSLALAVSVSSALVTAGTLLTRLFLPSGTSALPLVSSLTVVAATVFPSFFARLRNAGTALGVLFIQMFFAASGAAGSIKLVLKQAPSLFCFSSLQIAVHFLCLLLGGAILRLPRQELYLASNANVGGPTTAAAMAQAKHWKRLVVPGLLIGILGYAVATSIALALGPVLLRLPVRG